MKSSFFLILVFFVIFLLSGCTTPEKDTYVFSWTPPEEQERKFEIKEEFWKDNL